MGGVVKYGEFLDKYADDQEAFRALDLKGYPVAYYPQLAHVFGGVTAGILLSQFIYWHGKEKNSDGWIFKTVAEIQGETGLSRKEQRTARRYLKERGVLEEKKIGMPPINHYQFKWKLIAQQIFQWAQKGLINETKRVPTLRPKRSQQSAPNGPTYIEHRLLQETTAETTTKEKLPNGNHHAFIAYWCERYQQSQGIKYLFQDGKDGAAIKYLLRNFTVEEVKRVADVLLESDDPWFERIGKTIAVLRSQWNKLAKETVEDVPPEWRNIKKRSPKTESN